VAKPESGRAIARMTMTVQYLARDSSAFRSMITMSWKGLWMAKALGGSSGLRSAGMC
jgi:hypothetical protein